MKSPLLVEYIQNSPFSLKEDQKLRYTGIQYCNFCECQRTTYNNVCFACKNPISKPKKGHSAKQRRAFRNILFGVKKTKLVKGELRFWTLTTSELQSDNINGRDINQSFQVLRQRLKRITIAKLIKMGYIKSSGVRRYYPNKRLSDNLKIEYFKVRTNEGKGVLHILFRGDYLPYNWIVDNWQDIHNTWNTDIRYISVKGDQAMGVASYVVNQYMTNQDCSYTRFSQSRNWVFVGFVKRWYELHLWFKGEQLFKVWDCVLYQEVICQYSLDDYG